MTREASPTRTGDSRRTAWTRPVGQSYLLYSMAFQAIVITMATMVATAFFSSSLSKVRQVMPTRQTAESSVKCA